MTLLFDVLTAVGILTIVVLGLAIVLGVLDVINLAHTGFMAVGVYASVITHRAGWPFWIGILAGAAAAAVTGLVVEGLVIRRLYDRPLETILATWGISLIVIQALTLGFGHDNQAVGQPMATATSVAGTPYPTYRLLLILLAAALVVALALLMRFTRVGLTIRMVQSNQHLARALGIRVALIRAVTFVVGCAPRLRRRRPGPHPGSHPQLRALPGGHRVPCGAACRRKAVRCRDQLPRPRGGADSLCALGQPRLQLHGGHCGRRRSPAYPTRGVDMASRLTFNGRLPAAGALVAVLVFVVLGQVVGEYDVSLLTVAFIYGISAVSLDLVWGYVGAPDLGHGLWFGIGALTVGAMTTTTDSTGLVISVQDEPWRYAVALLLGIAIAAAVAGVVGRFAFSAKGSPFYIAVVTLALTTAATTLYSQFPTVTGGENGLFGFNPLTITTRAWYYLTLAALVLVTAGALILVRSDVGLLLRAVRDNEVRTRYLGYNVENVKTVTFMGGAGLAAFAGGLMALATGLVAADLFTFLFATQMMVWWRSADAPPSSAR